MPIRLLERYPPFPGIERGQSFQEAATKKNQILIFGSSLIVNAATVAVAPDVVVVDPAVVIAATVASVVVDPGHVVAATFPSSATVYLNAIFGPGRCCCCRLFCCCKRRCCCKSCCDGKRYCCCKRFFVSILEDAVAAVVVENQLVVVVVVVDVGFGSGSIRSEAERNN